MSCLKLDTLSNASLPVRISERACAMGRIRLSVSNGMDAPTRRPLRIDKKERSAEPYAAR